MHREHKAGQAAVDVLPRLQALPIELWQPVASLSVEELVRRLEAMGALPDPRPLERRELESAYAQAAEPTCAICQEDYEEGDPCRTLWPKCRHAYHVECFDRWALPACQNAPLPVPVLVPASPPCWPPLKSRRFHILWPIQALAAGANGRHPTCPVCQAAI